MVSRPLARARLLAQGLVAQRWSTPAEAVGAFGLMQGQETTVFSSVALRTGGDIDAVRASLDAGELVRSYPMRGTVFLGLASEMRWMTELLAKPGPDQLAARAAKEGVTPAHVEEIGRTVVTEGPVDSRGYQRIVASVVPSPTSAAVYRSRQYLLTSGVLAYVGAAQHLGPAPAAPGLEEAFNGDRQAAVDEVVRRYVNTRGPVTEADVRWWSKLPAREVRTALSQLPEADGYFLPIDDLPATPASSFRRPLLLPAFDEYILGYKDRLFAMTGTTHEHVAPGNMGVFRKTVVIDGVVRATWQGAGGRLNVADIAGVPKYAQPGIERAFRAYPFA